MKISKLFLVALGSVSLLVSCSKDNATTTASAGAYGKGVFVLNEGGSGQGSVSFMTNDLATFTQDIYTTANGSDQAGKYLQTMFFNGDYAYIIAGGSNTIDIVNKNTFKLVAKIDTGLANPRYGVVVGGKAYVTNANTYSYTNPTSGNTDDYVAVINLTTNLVEKSIPLNATANRILLENGKLYITEPYNNDKVLVLNPTTNTLETPIAVGSDADFMEVNNGTLYVMRSPYGAASSIVKVNLSDSSMTTIAFPDTLAGATNMDIYNNKIYYTAGTSVYAMDVTATAPSTTAVLTYTSTSANGAMYGFAVHNDQIFIADAADFAASGKAYVYSLSGALVKTFTVGVGPNGFYFNN